MVLLGIYVGCLIVGGGLVVASFFTDHDSDHDFDADCDVDVEADVDIDIDHDAEVAPSVDAGEALWLPFLSLRFWLFFTAFFGLIGTILHVGELAEWRIGLGVALGAGFVFGYTGSKIVQSLRHEKVSSAVDPHRDYVGKSGVVLLDIAPGEEGHVRLEAKGASVDLPALADHESLVRGTRIIVLAYEEGKLRVAKYDSGDGVKDRVPA